MSTATSKASSPAGGLAFSNPKELMFSVLRLFGLMVFNALGLIFVYSFLQDDNLGLAVVFAVITFGADIIFLVPGMYPFRWMAPGFALMALLVIYPLFYTVSTAFTNLGDSNLFTKDKSIALISDRGYVPEGATTYNWVLFQNGEDNFALWLVDDAGNIEFARPGTAVQPVSLTEFGFTLDEESGLPVLDGYEQLSDLSALSEISELEYDDPVGSVLIAPIDFDTRFFYDVEQAMVFDQEDGIQFEVSVLTNEAGDIGLWMIEADAENIDEALVYLPTTGLEEIDLEDRDELNDRNVDLAGGLNFVAETIDEFTLVADPDSAVLEGLTFGEVGDDYLQTATVDLSNRFVFDVEQGIALDRQTGDDFESVIYASDDGSEFALWMDGGRSGSFLARVSDGVLVNGVPANYEGYAQVSGNRERTNALEVLQELPLDYFGEAGDTIGIINTRSAGRPYQLRYVYDEELDGITDLSTDITYFADNTLGYFIPEGGTEDDRLNPGFRVNIGLTNFTRLVEDRTLLEPLINIFVWNVIFALLSVFTTFTVGLFMAIILDDPKLPGKKIIQSLLIIPYAIPGVISILVWRGMMNRNLGILTTTIADLTGYTVPWFSDPNMAKFAVILVNLWLGYPYMMLICSGALQAIPSDIYEAASVDGARTTAKFWHITMPLLLVTVGPLLIASFTFNFNNYLIIEALTQGNPVIEGTSTPAGYTDLLINYTYNLAFGSSRGADYGYASAITIVIFTLVAIVTMFNYRFTKSWEQVGESV